MRITNTDKEINLKSQIFKSKGFGHWALEHWRLFGIWCLIFGILSGCSQQGDYKEAQEYVHQARKYYQEAVDTYEALINKGDDLSRLHFELGKLYYNHGELEKAVREFEKSEEAQAKKFLGTSYYRLGQFNSLHRRQTGFYRY